MRELRNDLHLGKIDFLRGLAILLVFIYHSQLILFPNYEITDLNKNGTVNIKNARDLILNFSPTAFGGSGVNLFLIISGFLLHLGYLKNENSFNASTFYSKRFWRIFPPYWFSLLFFSFAYYGINYYLFSKTGLKDFILHFFTFHNLFDDTFFTINPSFWSLALEIQLYMLYPIFLILRKRIGTGWTFIIILSLSFFFLLIGILFNNFGLKQSYSLSVLIRWFVWVAGAYFAELYFDQKQLLKKGGLYISLIAFLAMIGSTYYLYTNYLSIYIGTLAWIILIDWFLNSETVKINSLLSKQMRTLGICSYSFYLIHQPILSQLLFFFNGIGLNSRLFYFRILNIIPVFLITFLISYISYKLIELPSVALGNRLRRTKK
jgi:peptidoglycan/LPS O-acetylase OafA/YrhL